MPRDVYLNFWYKLFSQKELVSNLADTNEQNK